MSRKERYANKLQINCFLDDYIRFEEYFNKYSVIDVPLTFLIDNIFRTMTINRKNYFKVNKENAKEGRNHYFHFKSRKIDSTGNLFSHLEVNSENNV